MNRLAEAYGVDPAEFVRGDALPPPDASVLEADSRRALDLLAVASAKGLTIAQVLCR